MKNFLFLLIATGIFAVCAVLLPYSAHKEYHNYKNYIENGYSVECTAVRTIDGIRQTNITAQYTDREGRPHTETLIRPYSRIRTGDTFTAYVLPEKPDKLCLKYTKGEMILMAVVGGMLFLLGISIPFIVAASIKTNKLIKAQGRLAIGTIIKTSVTLHGFRHGVVMFNTERGEERVKGVPLKKYQEFADDIDMLYAYDKKGKLHWRIK